MLKEIYEQPDAVRETIGDRVRHGRLELEGLGMYDDELRESAAHRHRRLRHRLPRRRRRPATCIEEWARIPVEPDIASEWRYRNPVIWPRTRS